MLGALIRNRGFGIRELPFMGLSLSTLYRMVSRWDPSPHRRQQLSGVAGPLGWTLPDLLPVAWTYGPGTVLSGSSAMPRARSSASACRRSRCTNSTSGCAAENRAARRSGRPGPS